MYSLVTIVKNTVLCAIMLKVDHILTKHTHTQRIMKKHLTMWTMLIPQSAFLTVSEKCAHNCSY